MSGNNRIICHVIVPNVPHIGTALYRMPRGEQYVPYHMYWNMASHVQSWHAVCIQTNHEAAKVAYRENIVFHEQNEVADLLPLKKKKERKEDILSLSLRQVICNLCYSVIFHGLFLKLFSQDDITNKQPATTV